MHRSRKVVFAVAAILTFMQLTEQNVSAQSRVTNLPILHVSELEMLYYLRRGIDTVPEELQTTLRNAGTGNLQLTGVKTSCGCSGWELSKEVLAEGESTTLTLKLDGSSFQADKAVHAEIQSNASNSDNSVITISIDWIEKVEFEPKYGLLNFEKISLEDVSKGVEKTLQIFQHVGAEPLQVLSVEDPLQLFETRIAPTKIEDMPIQEITLRLKPTTIAGFFDAPIFVHLSEEPGHFDARAIGLVVGDVEFEPERIIFSSMRSGGTRTRVISVKPIADEHTDVAFIESSSDALKVGEYKKTLPMEFNVTYNAGNRTGHIHEYVDIVTESGVRTRIPVRGDIVFSNAPEKQLTISDH